MLSKLKQLFEANSPAPQQHDVKLAAATLMFELIRSDGHVDEIELAQLRTVLQNHFELAEDDVQALIDDAQASAEDAISLQGFTRQICDNWGNEERVQLLEYLWVLALADNHVDAHERHLVRKVAGLLYLTDRQLNTARIAAEHRLNLG